MATRIQFRRGTASQWTAANPVLAGGEPGLETDTNKIKIGNGTSSWGQLAYAINEPGSDGREVELQKSATHIQWRYVGDLTWSDLVTLADLKGADGNDGAAGADGSDGREVELQKSATHIQWRHVGDLTWTDLITRADLKGADGNDGAAGADGNDGAAGADGREVELQKSATHIQWRYVGDLTWTNLVALTDLKGDPGDPGGSGGLGIPDSPPSGTYVLGSLNGALTWIATEEC